MIQSCSCRVTMVLATVIFSIAFGISDKTGAMLAPSNAFSNDIAVFADTVNSSTSLDPAIMALLDRVLTETSRNEVDHETDAFGICCISPDDGVTAVTCVPGPSCDINNQYPKGQCDKLHSIPPLAHKFVWCDDLTRSPTRAPTFQIPTPMPTFPDPYPRGMCPDGYYQTSLIAFEGCGPVTGEIQVEFTKANRGDPPVRILNLPLNVVNVTVNLTAVYDYDLFLLRAVDSYDDQCIVGFDCLYKLACDHLDGFHPCWPAEHAGSDPEEPVYFYSGDLEGHKSTEVTRMKKVSWEGYYFGVAPVQSGPATIRYSWNGIEPCNGYDYDQGVTDNCAVAPTRRPTRAPSKAPTQPPTRAPSREPTQAPSSTKAPTPANFDPSSSDIPAPAPPPPAPPADDEPFGGWGDPHLTNVKGEHFELNSPGEHLLVQIPRGSGHDFQLHATVAQFNSRSGRKACKFFFTNFSMSGAWLGINHNDKIDVWAGKGGSLDDFGLVFGKDRTITHFRKLAKTQDTTMLGGTMVEVCGDNVNSESYSLCQHLGHKFRRNPKKVLLTLPSPKPMHLAISRYESADPAFLDISVDGLGAHRSDDVGGLLGNDDHSKVSAWPADCKPKKPRNPRE